MKNNYEIKQSYIVQLENEQLRERVKELLAQINELKKVNETKERERVVQNQRLDAVI
jgi:cell division septum initiation protein DivIVA